MMKRPKAWGEDPCFRSGSSREGRVAPGRGRPRPPGKNGAAHAAGQARGRAEVLSRGSARVRSDARPRPAPIPAPPAVIARHAPAQQPGARSSSSGRRHPPARARNTCRPTPRQPEGAVADERRQPVRARLPAALISSSRRPFSSGASTPRRRTATRTVCIAARSGPRPRSCRRRAPSRDGRGSDPRSRAASPRPRRPGRREREEDRHRTIRMAAGWHV